VDYGSISSNLSGAAKCWLTQNLGASQQAISVTDNSEAAAGWYFQFNRKQGYQYTTTRIPSITWISGATDINENANWAGTNDPCNLLLGLGWRLPTSTEWINADNPPQNWGNATDAFNSDLKLHQAGYLVYSNGNLSVRGSNGYYWSNTQANSYLGNFMYIFSGDSYVTNTYKTQAFPVRCVQDNF